MYIAVVTLIRTDTDPRRDPYGGGPIRAISGWNPTSKGLTSRPQTDILWDPKEDQKSMSNLRLLGSPCWTRWGTGSYPGRSYSQPTASSSAALPPEAVSMARSAIPCLQTYAPLAPGAGLLLILILKAHPSGPLPRRRAATLTALSLQQVLSRNTNMIGTRCCACAQHVPEFRQAHNGGHSRSGVFSLRP